AMPDARRPPLLRVRHHRRDVFFHGSEIEGLELFGVVELRAHWIPCRVIRMEGVQVQLIRPPVAVQSAAKCCGRERALLFVVHLDVDLYGGVVAASPTTSAVLDIGASWRQRLA